MTASAFHYLLALFLAPLLAGVINRVKAKFAGRRGRPYLQLYYDLAKAAMTRLAFGMATALVAIFALAARRFGHEPAEMLFIDDNAANIAAARGCGSDALVSDAGFAALSPDLRCALRRHGGASAAGAESLRAGATRRQVTRLSAAVPVSGPVTRPMA